jgi:hypothetical protein
MASFYSWRGLTGTLRCTSRAALWCSRIVMLSKSVVSHCDSLIFHRPGSDLDFQAVRMMSLDNMTPDASRLTILLALFGIALVYFMRKSLRSPVMQQTLLAARAMRPKGSLGAQKRSV